VAMHEDHGSLKFSAHGMRSQSGEITMIIFTAAQSERDQADIARRTAARVGSDLVLLTEADLPGRLVMWVIETVMDEPRSDILLTAGERWGVDGDDHELADG
jgi:hypothetical protein